MKSFSEASSLLNAATDAASVEAALEDVTTHSIESEEAKEALLKSLQDVQSKENLTINAKLRRKIKRLQELLLAPPEEKKEEKKIEEIPTTTTTTNSTTTTSTGSSDLKSFDEAIDLLNKAKDNNEVEKALEGVTLSSPGSVISKNKLINSLQDIQENESIVLNAKVRRKLKRLQEMLSAAPVAAAAPAPSAAPAAAPASASAPSKVISKPLSQATEELLNTTDVTIIEKVLEGVTTSSKGSIIERNKFLSVLNDIEENKEINLNSKLRRRIKRLNELLLSDVFKPTDSSTDSSATATSASLPFNIEDKDLTEFIEVIKETKDLNLFEDYLSFIRPGIGNCNSRRKLKRSLESIMSANEEEDQETSEGETVGSKRKLSDTIQLNDHLKKRCQRAISYLSSENINNRLIRENEEKLKNEEREKEKLLKKLNEETNKNKHGNIVPYVVFVGQLDYSLTKEEIKDFFVKKGELTDEIIVRVRTNPQTKKFEGKLLLLLLFYISIFILLYLIHFFS